MVNIDKELNSIMKEQLGKNVIQSIHDGILKLYSDPSKSIPSTDSFKEQIVSEKNQGTILSVLIADGSVKKESMNSELQTVFDSLGVVDGDDGNTYELYINEQGEVTSRKVV